MTRESYLYKKLPGGVVQCQTCNHYCVLAPNEFGLCGARQNQAGVLMVLPYGQAIAAHVDPIEKKPLYHFLPGTQTFSFAAAGCNFKCANCQNWQISQATKNRSANKMPDFGFDLPPAKIISQAQAANCPSLSYTYTEPTIFLEYALETMKLAKDTNLKNIWVSNGFMSPETLKLILPYLDAINVDLKSFDENFYQKTCGARLKPVLENLKSFKKAGIWIEITTLIIPTLSDSEKMLAKIAKFIKEKIGPETPWHLSQFSNTASWRLQTLPPTSKETIERACQIGREAGLYYVYAGNVESKWNNTFCSQCQLLNIERNGFTIKRQDQKGRCYTCGTDLDITE